MTEALNITTTPRDDHQLDVRIELGPERTDQALQRGAKILANRAKIPGFRPGKAPFVTVMRMFGREAILSEVLDDIGQEVYREVLETATFQPYSEAALNDIELDPIAFKLIVPLQPTVELGDYRSIRIEAPEVPVTEAEVDEVIEQERSKHATSEVVERAADVEDTVVMDITGTIGNETIMDNVDWELVVKSETGWLPGFDEQFIGVSAGDEKNFKLTYPETSSSKYKGQEASFSAKIKSIKGKVKPALDDEFAKSLGEYESLEELRAKTLEGMQQARAQGAENKLTNDAMDAVVAGATMAYPPNAVHEVVHEMLNDMQRQLARIGYRMEDFLRLQGKTAEQNEEELKPEAERRLKARLALGELIRREKLSASADEIETELQNTIAESSRQADEAEVRKVFDTDAGRFVVENDLLRAKGLVRLREIVTGQAPELEPDPEPSVETTGAEAEVVTPAVPAE